MRSVVFFLVNGEPMTDPQSPNDTGDQAPPGGVPLGVAVDDRPVPKPSRAATNDAADRRRAFLLIGSILCGVLLLTVLGQTVLRPFIGAQRERTLIRITSDQLEVLAALVDREYQQRGVLILNMQDLLLDDQLETSDGRDLWGTPFALGTEDAGDDGRYLVVVRSAGPDREFGTSDDLAYERLLSRPEYPELED